MSKSPFQMVKIEKDGSFVEVEKNLANCNAVELLMQTNKIRKAVEKWLADTGILNIRKNVPQPPKMKPLEYPQGATEEEKEKMCEEYQREKQALEEGHRKVMREQVKKNMIEMLDKALDEYPMETLEILGLICFIEKKDLDKVNGAQLLRVATDTLTDDEVIRFFTSLVSLEQKVTFKL